MHQSMSNVDAVRMLADAHHLEFVDLERFNVDASVSTVVPVAVARKHHVVPIGRRFGAPVVATSNPADVVAMDDLRAVIGREFVAVVASDEQIDECLSLVYGEKDKRKPPSAGSKTRQQADSANGAGSQVNGSVATAPPPTETETRSAPPPPPLPPSRPSSLHTPPPRPPT